MIESSALEEGADPPSYADAWTRLKSADGILVPGGFGVRGIEGKIAAVRYAREKQIPFLGICLGMQAAVIEFARNQLGILHANSKEFAPEITDLESAVIFMPEGSRDQLGGTMRLGSRRTILRKKSLASGFFKIDFRYLLILSPELFLHLCTQLFFFFFNFEFF
jgi:CTP synthase